MEHKEIRSGEDSDRQIRKGSGKRVDKNDEINQVKKNIEKKRGSLGKYEEMRKENKQREEMK